MDTGATLADSTIGDTRIMLVRKGYNFGYYIGILRETDEYIHSDSFERAVEIHSQKIREALYQV